MSKKILFEANLKVSGITHKKDTKKGEHEYKYGAIVINSQKLSEHIGKIVKVKIEETKQKKKQKNNKTNTRYISQ